MGSINVTYKRRADWGAKPPKQALTPFTSSRVKGILVHHTVGPKPSDHSNCDNEIRRLQSAAFNEGYRDIEYNFLICGHGVVFEGRGWNKSGANHPTNPDYNEEYVAICYLGTDPKPTMNNLEALFWLRERLFVKYGKDANNLWPHSKVRATACPGTPMRSWLKAATYIS